MRNPMIMLNEAYKITMKNTSDLINICPYDESNNLTDNDFAEFMGKAIIYKVDKEVELLAMAIDIMIANDTDIQLGVQDLKHVLESSDLFIGSKLICLNKQEPRNKFVFNNINSLMINLSNFITMKLYNNWKYANMDEIMIQCRAMILITFEKIEQYISSILG